MKYIKTSFGLTDQPQLGVQATLSLDFVHIGSTTLLFAMSISCAVCLAVGQAVFQAQLSNYLAEVVPEKTAHAILTAGVSQVKSVVKPEDYARVVKEYSNALTDIFVSANSYKTINKLNAPPVYTCYRPSSVAYFRLLYNLDHSANF